MNDSAVYVGYIDK